jgi:hypothetical protein
VKHLQDPVLLCRIIIDQVVSEQYQFDVIGGIVKAEIEPSEFNVSNKGNIPDDTVFICFVIG